MRSVDGRRKQSSHFTDPDKGQLRAWRLPAVQPFVSRVWAAGYAHTYATASDAYMQYSTVTARIVLLSLT